VLPNVEEGKLPSAKEAGSVAKGAAMLLKMQRDQNKVRNCPLAPPVRHHPLARSLCTDIF